MTEIPDGPAFRELQVGDLVRDNEGDESTIAEIARNGRITTDEGWTYWNNEITVIRQADEENPA